MQEVNTLCFHTKLLKWKLLVLSLVKEVSSIELDVLCIILSPSSALDVLYIRSTVQSIHCKNANYLYCCFGGRCRISCC